MKYIRSFGFDCVNLHGVINPDETISTGRTCGSNERYEPSGRVLFH